MLTAETVFAAREYFWLAYVIALTCGLGASLLGRNATLARAVIALAAGSVAQTIAEGEAGYLLWWQHMAIDVPIFIAVTIPPRSYWQTALAGMLFAQLWLHAVWAVSPDFAWPHYALCLYLGFAKCAALLLWSGGRRVEIALNRAAGFVARMVLASPAGKLA